MMIIGWISKGILKEMRDFSFRQRECEVSSRRARGRWWGGQMTIYGWMNRHELRICRIHSPLFLCSSFFSSLRLRFFFNTDYGSSEPLKTLVMLCYSVGYV